MTLQGTEFYASLWSRYRCAREFRTRIRAALQENGVTQAQLAKVSGFTYRQISEWVGERSSGAKTPSLESRLMVDEALEILIRARSGE